MVVATAIAITTPITDAGTVVGIIYEGAIPVFADVDPAKLGANAKTIGDAIRAEGIPCGTGYVAPVYLQYEFFRTQAAFNHSTWPFSHHPVPPYGPGYCPNAERVALECLNFPLNQWLSEQEIDDTLAAAAKVAAAFRKRAGR